MQALRATLMLESAIKNYKVTIIKPEKQHSGLATLLCKHIGMSLNLLCLIHI